ncbi:MAG: putative hydrolase of alpha/beta superfamily protein [Bacteroidetes bacterium OLB9]|nr:MAG: putative hydrolase of alpha/beta superfamily protein [Bacteroidetes bacterium OLB9]
MKKYFLSVLFYFAIGWTCLVAQLTIKVVAIPASTPPNSSIYIAGNFNSWDPGSSEFKLEQDAQGVYAITFAPSMSNLEFKFTRGSWDNVEGTAQGSYIPNRTLTYHGGEQTIEFSIAGWEDGVGASSTASAQVSILSTSFDMPQLNRKRRIWLYLPKDYYSSSSTYPVLYMHDGQNLFDKKTSFAGEWQVDESLDSLFEAGKKTAIVVGIDNGGASRLDEYSPWVNTKYGGGEGDEYVDFIVKTLKPYIDQHFRTKKEAEFTGIMGSSMGGLISMYAGIKYPDVFSRVGAFSSSYWFSPSSYTYVSEKGVSPTSFMYLIAGGREGGSQVSDMRKMYNLLLASGAIEQQLYEETHPDGQHSEWYWRREFPKAFVWLFNREASDVKDVNLTTKITAYQRGNELILTYPDVMDGNLMSVYDSMGRQIIHQPISRQLDLSNHPMSSGIYIIKVGDQSKRIYIRM